MENPGFEQRVIADERPAQGESVVELEAKLAAAREVETRVEKREQERQVAIAAKRSAFVERAFREIESLEGSLAEAALLDDGGVPSYPARNVARAFLSGGHASLLVGCPDPALSKLAGVHFRATRAMGAANGVRDADLDGRLDALEIDAWSALIERAQRVANPRKPRSQHLRLRRGS